MLNVDISNIWCSVTLPVLLESEQEIAAAHLALMDGVNNVFHSWLDQNNAAELDRVMEVAQTIRESAQVLVVAGNDSAVMGAQAALELLLGREHNLRRESQILFTGSDFSTRAWQNLSELLETRDFCVQVVDGGGETVQTALAARALRWLLERRYGTEKARERFFVTTDPTYGALRQSSVEEGYPAFNLPRAHGGGHAGVLTPAALLPLAVAGVDIRALLAGAAAARTDLEIRSFENPAWLYAAARTILARRGRRVEYLSAAEPDAWSLCRWWARLFGQRACPGGLLPAMAELPAELHQLWVPLSDGAVPLMQTVLRFAPPEQKVQVEMDWKNLDGLNYLKGFTLDYVQEQAVAAAIQAGVDGSVPIVTIDCEAVSPRAAGELLYFFELTSSLCAGMMGLVPGDAAAAPYVRSMTEALGR